MRPSNSDVEAACYTDASWPLQAFTDTEELGGEDSHTCGRCRSKQPTTKRLRICRCPPVLVLHLKRFSMNASPLCISPLMKVCKIKSLDSCSDEGETRCPCDMGSWLLAILMLGSL